MYIYYLIPLMLNIIFSLRVFFERALYFLLPFIVSVILYKMFIPILYKLNFGQVVRSEGPTTHLKKVGTPTMGGIIIIVGAVFAYFVNYINDFFFPVKFINSIEYGLRNEYILYIIGYIVIMGIVGFIDDILKIKFKNSKGMPAKIKLLLQLIVSCIFIYFVFIKNSKSNEFLNQYGSGLLREYFIVDKTMLIPFTNGNIYLSFEKNIFLSIVFIIAVVFILIGTNNGTNFTDGLDGLLASVTMVVSLFFAAVCIRYHMYDIMLFNIEMFAILLAFFLFNKYPAKIFMGDTGSLAIGAYVASMASILGLELFLPIFGFIYFIEVISVILQVSYFKITKGKRLFKMAPIHHHFEKLGFKEKNITKMFTFITIVCCIISYFAM